MPLWALLGHPAANQRGERASVTRTQRTPHNSGRTRAGGLPSRRRNCFTTGPHAVTATTIQKVDLDKRVDVVNRCIDDELGGRA
jgi:hypothetical protein